MNDYTQTFFIQSIYRHSFNAGNNNYKSTQAFGDKKITYIDQCLVNGAVVQVNCAAVNAQKHMLILNKINHTN